jgi:hypothetical protein
MEAGLTEFDRERQADVAETHDPGAGRAGLDLVEKSGGER